MAAAAVLAFSLGLASAAAAQSSHRATATTLVSSSVGGTRGGSTFPRNTFQQNQVAGPLGGVAIANAQQQGVGPVRDTSQGPSGTYSGNAFAVAGIGRLGVSASNSVVVTQQNTSIDMTNSVQASMVDVVTAKDLGSASQRNSVVWVGKLLLSGDISGSAGASTGGGRGGAAFNGNLQVTGSGVQPCPNGVCMSKSFSILDTPNGVISTTNGTPLFSEITWTMTLNLNSPTPIGLSMLLLGGASAFLDVGQGASSATFNGNFAHTLIWGDGAQFFDPITGEELGDISLTSASGLDYINPGFETTAAVPEPTIWALMLGGFGLAGAALRRRRALAL